MSLAKHLRPCSVSNTTIPILSAGTDLISYLETAQPSSVALVKMPNIHPDIFANLVRYSPFPMLCEGRSSWRLLYNLGKPGIHTNRVSYDGYNISSIVEIFRQALDPKSPLSLENSGAHTENCKPENDVFFQTIEVVDNYLNLTSEPNNNSTRRSTQPNAEALNTQLRRLHYENYIFSAITPAAIIAGCNTLYKRNTLSYSKATLLKYGLLIADGYANSRLTSNILLIIIDAISELGFDSEISLLLSIAFLHNIINWIIYFPTSIPEASTHMTEVASSCVGAAIGRVGSSLATNAACNSAGWFYRQSKKLYLTAQQEDAPILPIFRCPKTPTKSE